jgi:mRNA interferase MazF
MPAINAGEVWWVDFGLAAKVRPALLLTGTPADDELDLVTVLLHTTALRGNRWELSIPKPFLKPGAGRDRAQKARCNSAEFGP